MREAQPASPARPAQPVMLRPIPDQGLVGTLVTPGDAGPWPGVIVLPGSAGRVPDHLARRLAADGIAALALAYFGQPPLPPRLVEVPLKYIERAARWLRDSGDVHPGIIGLLGGSKGAELALLCAATFPELIGPVAAAAPSSVVWHGLELTLGNVTTARPSEHSSWSWRDAPVPFVPASDVQPTPTGQGLRVDVCYGASLDDADTVERAAIPVERSAGPLLLLSGQDDHVWPSTDMAAALIRRMADHDRAGDIEHVSYPGAGHAVLPLPDDPLPEPVASPQLDLGGRPEANAFARADGWRRVSAFLTHALADPA